MGAPALCVSGQTGGKARIKRGKSKIVGERFSEPAPGFCVKYTVIHKYAMWREIDETSGKYLLNLSLV